MFGGSNFVTLKVPTPELSTTGPGGEGLTAGLGMISGRNMIYIFITKQIILAGQWWKTNIKLLFQS